MGVHLAAVGLLHEQDFDRKRRPHLAVQGTVRDEMQRGLPSPPVQLLMKLGERAGGVDARQHPGRHLHGVPPRSRPDEEQSIPRHGGFDSLQCDLVLQLVAGLVRGAEGGIHQEGAGSVLGSVPDGLLISLRRIISLRYGDIREQLTQPRRPTRVQFVSENLIALGEPEHGNQSPVARSGLDDGNGIGIAAPGTRQRRRADSRQRGRGRVSLPLLGVGRAGARSLTGLIERQLHIHHGEGGIFDIHLIGNGVNARGCLGVGLQLGDLLGVLGVGDEFDARLQLHRVLSVVGSDNHPLRILHLLFGGVDADYGSFKSPLRIVVSDAHPFSD